MIRRMLVVGTLCLALAGCTTVNVVPNGENVSDADPTWQERQHFFLFGLIGESHVDVGSICGEKEVLQMQSRFMPLDGLIGLVTASIYAPRTARVWCE